MASNSTGWDNGLCQDYNGDLGRWFANRLGARHQLRKEFEMSKAQELAAEMQRYGVTTMNRWATDGAALLHTQDTLLRQALEALDIAFSYEGDVFGKQHNDITDTYIAIQEILK